MQIYTTTTAAEILEVQPDTVRELCRKGQLKGYKTLKKWFILHSDLVEFITKGKTI